ncbi:MAG: four helix bundle protein [Clostridia bacterium]
MKENKLVELSMEIAIDIVNTCKQIKAIKKEHVLTNQLLRSGTSIGANIREANYAHSKADFIAKLQIALKECYESEYWIELLYKTDYMDLETTTLLSKKLGCARRILISSINTTKNHI